MSGFGNSSKMFNKYLTLTHLLKCYQLLKGFSKSFILGVKIICLVEQQQQQQQSKNMPLCGLALHSSPQHSVSSLFLINDLSVHSAILNNFPHFFPIILSLLLSLLHCGLVTPERERGWERQFERGEKEKEDMERVAEGKVSISQQTNRVTLRR